MSAVTYPNVLLPATWDKNKGLLAKVKPTGIGEALKGLQKQHDSLAFDKFEPSKVRTVEDGEALLDLLDGAVRKAVKGISESAKQVEGLGKKWEAEFKKDKLIPKSAAQAAGDVGKAAHDYGASLGQWHEAAQEGIEKRISELLAAQAKTAKTGPHGEPLETKEFKLVRGKVLTALRTVKANKPAAPPTHFMIGLGKTSCSVYMAPAVSASHKTLLMKLMAGDTGIKFYVGTCIWEAKAYTFVGGAGMPTSGLAKKVQKALKDQTKGLFKVRIKKDTGEVEEVEGQDDPDLIPDEEGDQPTQAPTGSGAQPQGTAPKTVPDATTQVTRLKGIRGELDKLALKNVGLKDKLSQAQEQFKTLLSQNKPAEALKVLERLEELAKGEPSQGSKAPLAPPPSGKVETASQGMDKALENVRLSITGIPQVKVQAPLATELKELSDKKAEAVRLAEPEALKQLNLLAGLVLKLGQKATKVHDEAVEVTGRVKSWGSDRVDALQKAVDGLSSAGKSKYQGKVDAQALRVKSAQERLEKGEYPSAKQEVSEVYFAVEKLLDEVKLYKTYQTERGKVEAAIEKLKKHDQAPSLKAEINNLEQRLLAADKLGPKTPGLGWKQASIAIKPLLELCARHEVMADKMTKVAAKLPALTKKLQEGGADETSAKKMAVYAQKMLVEEDCSDDEAVEMAKDANGFATEDHMDEQDALMSSHVKHSLVKGGVDAGTAKEVGRNIRAGGSASADDAKAVGKGLTRLSKPVLQNLNKAGIKTQCCRGPATEVLADLSGVQPRGWPEGMTWDSVPGCYSPSTKQVVVGTMDDHGKRKVPGPNEGPIPHGTPDLIGHEAGHAFDASEGALKSTNAEFLKARTADVKLGKPKGMYGPRDNYFLTKAEGGTNDAGATSETFAESFAMHFGKNSRWPTLESFWAKNPWSV